MLLTITIIVVSTPVATTKLEKRVRYQPIENVLRTLDANIPLNPVERVFVPMQIRGTMLFEGSLKDSGIQCQASTILHEEVQPLPSRSDVFWVPHSRIVVDGQRCGTGRPNEYMLIVAGRDLAKRAVADERGLARVYTDLLCNSRGMHVFMMLHAIDKVHVGVEISAHRICGGRVVYSRGTTFVFVSSSISKLNLGFASLRKRQVGMVAVLNNQNMCAYQDDFVDNKLAVPSPSVTPPIPVSPAPSDTFKLTLPNLKDIEDPSPSPSVTPSKRPVIPKTDTPPKVPSPPIKVSPEPSLSLRSPTHPPKACFPNDASVHLRDGSEVSIASLGVGDRIRTGKNTYSTIFMFTHKSSNVISQFVVLTTESGHIIELSDGHYISTSNGGIVSARNVRIGDTLLSETGNTSVVTHIGRATKRGLHNPQTLDGNIVVNGIVASCFTEAIPEMMAVSILTPVRAVYRLGIWSKPFYKTFWESDRGLFQYFSTPFLQRCWHC